jgi:ribonuclease VapC
LKRYVLDSYAALVFLKNQAGAGEVEDILSQAAAEKAKCLMSVVNWGEVYYMSVKQGRPEDGDSALQALSQLPVDLVSVGPSLALEAALIKSEHRLAYADAFAAALAKQSDASVITGDPEFKALEREVSIHWLPAVHSGH